MRNVLHIVTKPDDALAREMIARQGAGAEITVEVADLTVPEPDYADLLEKIFKADGVVSW